MNYMKCQLKLKFLCHVLHLIQLGLVVTYLVQCTYDLPSLLVYHLWAPVTVYVFQCLCNSIVFSEPQRVQRSQRQTFADPAVSCTEAFNSFPLQILVAGWWQLGYKWEIRPSFWIFESGIDSKFSVTARKVTKEALQLLIVAVDSRSVNEWSHGIELLSLQGLSYTRLKIDKAVWCGAKKWHTAL